MSKPKIQRRNVIKWYRTKHDRNTFLRVSAAPLPALSYIKTPLIYKMWRFRTDGVKVVEQETVYGTLETVAKLYTQVRYNDLPKSVRRVWMLM